MDRHVWRAEVSVMTGASPDAVGTAPGQQHLREILSILGAHVLPREAYTG